jgi:hypothetical protein
MALTNKTINLLQLDQELGSKGLNGDFNDPKNKIIIPVAGSNVTEAELEAAIAAHIAQPTEQEIRVLNREQGIVKLKELGLTEDEITALLNGM